MSNAKLAWELLVGAVGDYRGRGVNHEEQIFTGGLSLKFEFENKVLLLTSSATGGEFLPRSGSKMMRVEP